MVPDGYFYAAPLAAAAGLLLWLTSPGWALVPLILAVFFLWFFRDPERAVPATAGTVVSPADGKITLVSQVTVDGTRYHRISIFLNVFDVHVNRSPIAGTITGVSYKKGKFLNAAGQGSAEENEQNMVTVTGDGHTVIFKQIAGLLARRIVFRKQPGDRVARGERVGMIKFGSRVDVLLESSARITVAAGERVKGASSVLAQLTLPEPVALPEGVAEQQGAS